MRSWRAHLSFLVMNRLHGSSSFVLVWINWVLSTAATGSETPHLSAKEVSRIATEVAIILRGMPSSNSVATSAASGSLSSGKFVTHHYLVSVGSLSNLPVIIPASHSSCCFAFSLYGNGLRIATCSFPFAIGLANLLIHLGIASLLNRLFDKQLVSFLQSVEAQHSTLTHSE